MAKILMTLINLSIVFLLAAPVQSANLYVTSPSTGVAIHGFDPVAYFDKNAAVMGVEGIEAEWSNTYWKFENVANKERFLDSPQIYVPQFNGYGAYSVAIGRLSEGNPHIWAIYNNRLLLFHSLEARKAWVENPVKYQNLGEQKWKDLRATLPRYE